MQAVFKPMRPVTAKMMGMDGVREEMLNEMRKLGNEAKKTLEGAFATWEHRPKVEMKIHLSRSDPEAGIEIYTADEIANYVDKGTEPHWVAPRYAPALSWQAHYTRKSRVGSLVSYSGGHSGVWRSSLGHRVSGIKARKFSYTLERYLFRIMAIRLQAAAIRGAAKH